MHEAAATPAWVLLAYLISGVCFILALRGLSSPESSRRGNLTGMFGMAIAVGTTLASATATSPSHFEPTLSAAADAISAPTTITEDMALVTLISGVCSDGVTDQTT